MSTRRLHLPLLAVALSTAVTASGPASIVISASGTNGDGTSEQPGVPCADGGSGASWRYTYGAELTGGEFSSVPGELQLYIELHSENTGASPPYEDAWLAPEQSRVTLSNPRGSMTLGLASGSCDAPTLAFNGTFASGPGTWAVSDNFGSYREATGSGTFTLMASVGPGSDNPFSIGLSGLVTVLTPGLAAELISARWEPGSSGGSRNAAVTYRITNTGPGDAFGVRLLASSSPAPGITVVSTLPLDLGDLLIGESALAQVRYALQDRESCGDIRPSCTFEASVSVELPDALDNPTTADATLSVRVPTAPQAGN
jgi:hypothetical protein